jgi:hypothetical protein
MTEMRLWYRYQSQTFFFADFYFIFSKKFKKFLIFLIFSHFLGDISCVKFEIENTDEYKFSTNFSYLPASLFTGGILKITPYYQYIT